MKHRHLYLIVLATVFFLAPRLQAQNMVLRLQGGTDQTILLSSLQKITFSNSNLVLNYTSGSTQSYSFSNLEKLFFSPYTAVKNTVNSKADIFFNPSIDMSGFPASIYLIRINNQILKFKK